MSKQHVGKMLRNKPYRNFDNFARFTTYWLRSLNWMVDNAATFFPPTFFLCDVFATATTTFLPPSTRSTFVPPIPKKMTFVPPNTKKRRLCHHDFSAKWRFYHHDVFTTAILGSAIFLWNNLISCWAASTPHFLSNSFHLYNVILTLVGEQE